MLAMLGGVFYFILELTPTPSPTPIAIETEPEPELKITVLQTIPDFASVVIDIPPTSESLKALKTELIDGILKVSFRDTEKNIPLFPNIDSLILHSEFTENRVILEVSKQ